MDLVDRLLDNAMPDGAEIGRVYATDFDFESRRDKSLSTEADESAKDLILNGLPISFRDIPAMA